MEALLLKYQSRWNFYIPYWYLFKNLLFFKVIDLVQFWSAYFQFNSNVQNQIWIKKITKTQSSKLIYRSAGADVVFIPEDALISKPLDALGIYNVKSLYEKYGIQSQIDQIEIGW